MFSAAAKSRTPESGCRAAHQRTPQQIRCRRTLIELPAEVVVPRIGGDDDHPRAARLPPRTAMTSDMAVSAIGEVSLPDSDSDSRTTVSMCSVTGSTPRPSAKVVARFSQAPQQRGRVSRNPVHDVRSPGNGLSAQVGHVVQAPADNVRRRLPARIPLMQMRVDDPRQFATQRVHPRASHTVVSRSV